VVARSQYRGTVKRRTQLLYGLNESATTLPAPGAEVFAGPEREQPVGELVLAAQQGERLALLAELQLAAWEGQAPLQLADGRLLERAALPYAIKAPE
jgi:folate-binding Fe-S cluster repair protein YgfZ